MQSIQCIHCGSNRTRRRGLPNADKNPNRYRHSCNDCGKSTFTVFGVIEKSFGDKQPVLVESVVDDDEDEQIILSDQEQSNIDEEDSPVTFFRDSDYIKTITSKKTIVITSAQNNAEVDHGFIDSLETYCRINDAALVVIPIKYKIGGADAPAFSYDDRLLPYLVDNNIMLPDHQVNILCNLKLLATAVNPLAAMDAFSKGNTLVLGHSQLQLRTLARGKDRKYPPILTTTGSVTKEMYSLTKSGTQADFNHCMSAVVLELTDTEFFLRHLNYDTDNKCFYDMNIRWDGGGSTYCRATALVTGDTHVGSHDAEVYNATFCDGSLVDVLCPRYLISHDVLDFHSRSHHSIKDQFVEYIKHRTETDDVKAELDMTCQYIIDNTPVGVKNIIVCSNHDTHLNRWLKEADIRKDPVNAKIYHYLSYLMYEKMSDDPEHIPQAFEVYFEDYLKKNPSNCGNVVFLDEFDTFKLHGIELAIHSHIGQNGSRGSVRQFANVPDKMVVGHSHCFIDGHSALTKSGWKPIHEIAVGEDVLSYDHITNTNVFVPNMKTHIHTYTGEIVNINTAYFKQSVTPNHNMFLRDGSYENIGSVIASKGPYVIPLNSYGIQGDDGITMNERLIRQIVAVCADGSFYKNSLRFHIKKQRKIDRIISLFGVDSFSESGVRLQKTGNTNITISKESQVYKDVVAYTGSTTTMKRLPEIFRKLTPRCMEIVIDELTYWDGTYVGDDNRSGRQWGTSKKDEADLISSMLVQLGYRTSMYTRLRKPNYVMYIVSWCMDKTKIWSSQLLTHNKALRRMWGIETTYVENKRVSCLTTKQNNFWVKHDDSGQVSLSGNSPNINKGCYQVGTSTKFHLPYQKGLSSWDHCHCIIHENGKRQMIFLRNGKFWAE